MDRLYTTYYASPVGTLQISCNDTCITQVHFLRDEETAQPNEAGAPPLLRQCVDQLIEYFQGQRRHFDVPVYQQGTGFQQRVWNELLTIPYGKTISYLTL